MGVGGGDGVGRGVGGGGLAGREVCGEGEGGVFHRMKLKHKKEELVPYSTPREEGSGPFFIHRTGSWLLYRRIQLLFNCLAPCFPAPR